MSEKTNPELNTEETAASVSEDTEKTILADNDEAIVNNDTENTVSADTTVVEAAADTAVNEELTDITATEEEQPKKKSVLQKPIIIACCIVLAAILGFFVYMAFFLKEPENVTWTSEVNGSTFYYEFKSDGTFTGYLGSIEISGSFQKTNGEEGKTITVDKTCGNFYQSMPATYSISGSRLFGNQTMTCSYGQGQDMDFTLTQGKREKNLLDLPEDFTPDENLTGTWIFKYMNYDLYKVTFNNDGSMILEFIQEGVKYNGIYTLEGSTINFTYYANESAVVPIEYTVNGDYLTFMGYPFVREGSDAEKATSDQQALMPQANNQAQETQAAEAVTEAAEAKEAAE